MTISFKDSFLPAASTNQAYSQYLSIDGGTAPYQFALTGGSMPPGLTLSDTGLISGTATTLGLYPVTFTASDSSTPTPQIAITTYQFQVLDLINLLDSTVDQAQFVQQFENDLANTQTWSTGLTTMTSQTLIELASAVGTYLTARISRATEDMFPETAQSDSSIRAITTMQGLRLARKLPATVPATLISTITQTLPPFTQISGGGHNWFTKTAIPLVANVPVTATLREGLVRQISISGLGSDLQTWVAQEDSFSVSDQDVVVALNGQDLTKAYGALWNFPNVGAYADSTLSDGRLNIQFGSQGYGTVPGVNDLISITYTVTQGDAINGLALTGTSLSGSSVSALSGTFTGNPNGGAPEKSTIAYKNFAAGSFGTYSSAVTKSQYAATVANYPGIVDAVTQAQREINPALLKWMNVIRVSPLTASPWSQDQINEYISYLQSVTMYQPKFLWQDPLPMVNNVDVSVYCFNSVNSLDDVKSKVTKAIQNLFAKRPGILMTDLYVSDIIDTILAAALGLISYVQVNRPTGPMIVTKPLSPKLTATINVGAGAFIPGVYDYAVSVDAAAPSPHFVGYYDPTTNSGYPVGGSVPGDYWIVSKAGTLTTGGFAIVKGDQILLGVNAYAIVSQPAGLIEVGDPTNWINPQVTETASNIVISWSANPVSSALTYHIWGRTAGIVGIIASVDASVLQYTDVYGSNPTPVNPGTSEDTRIRYNTLGSLAVSVSYSARQTNALLPIRDSNQ